MPGLQPIKGIMFIMSAVTLCEHSDVSIRQSFVVNFICSIFRDIPLSRHFRESMERERCCTHLVLNHIINNVFRGQVVKNVNTYESIRLHIFGMCAVLASATAIIVLLPLEIVFARFFTLNVIHIKYGTTAMDLSFEESSVFVLSNSVSSNIY